MLKKRNGLALVISLVVLLLVGCTSTSSDVLSDKFDQKEVQKQAETAIELFNNQDYQALIQLFPEDLQKEMSQDSFKKAFEKFVADKGELKEFGKTTMRNEKNTTGDGEVATTILPVEYQKGSLNYMISINEQGELTNFLVK
ncbi:DUF3887 domain-containing protein [Carnobacterium maltaromaticum]|uniref:DUF3887 domain-containing protein n=1 Tax=Carnobacterium maltaromaticum TaxID=2751 RepID=A0AAW9JQP0_CARML|nr:DUF3887 domain-containing protein [Carnobacterium maltaromaticum]KRN86168.1 hypothetical protein IV75_GL001891 [Carnobacterium maltaromaticum]MDT1943678.1 DUF3887 domain-containing protein [Carnobacterium maltaromaticum]MDT1999058.1 DUF3887 domain-containing protein [Carnobacterium maltaromaticum]MDZ5758990.1 DUF3887 domain-containing protein [Carnobacterium maltaromaticum]TFJ24512.1 DUF3887 domain-containing protein [Carnobacterium maltaromaticum]